MAFQQGIAQTVHVATLDGAEPTAPTSPVVTVSLDNGATFEAPDNAATTAAYGVALVLSAAETARDLVLVRVASDNCDTALREVYFEADWTAAKANNLDAAVSSRSTLTAQQVWEYGTRTLSSYGTLVADIVTAVWAAATRTLTQAIGATTITCGGTNIVDGDLEVEVPRGDSYSLVVTVTDDDDAAIDLSGYDEHTFSVKADAYRDDDDDTNVLFQATGSLSGDDNNVLTFAITPTQTELGTRDQWYDCDIECRNTEGTSVRTVIRGRYRTTYDVTRGS
jgi:hypothetical protein